ALIMVEEGGQNLIAVAPGANATVAEGEVRRVLEALRPDDLLVLQLEIPMRTVRTTVERAATLGARVVLNAAPAAELDAETLRGLEVLVVNEDEARALPESGPPALGIS